MNGQNLEFLNTDAQSASSMTELRSRNLIAPGSPNWWSTDYAPDPREYLPFEEFYDRLVDVGDGVKLYPSPQVPMAVLSLDVGNDKFHFMVTARPYHERESESQEERDPRHSPDKFYMDKVRPFDEVRGQARTLISTDDRGFLARPPAPEIPNQCLPHIRGMFIEARGAHLFWSTLHAGKPRYDKIDFREKVQNALGDAGIFGVIADNFMGYSSFMNRTMAHREATTKGLIRSKRSTPDFNFRKVSRPEYIDGLGGEEELGVLYPARIPGVEATLPVLVTNRTHAKSRVNKPVVLGLEASSGFSDNRYGLWTFQERDTCRAISDVLSKDFETEVDVLLRTPRKGLPEYERVNS